MSNILLSVDIDHIATLRNARDTFYPDPLQAAFILESAGADGITFHLREDRRYITDRDVFLLKKIIQSSINLEIAPTEEMIAIACELKPNSCCLVPENRREITTENGLDILSNQDSLCNVIFRLQSSGINVSLFLDVDKKKIAAAVDCGVSCIELDTGSYVASSNNIMARTLEFDRFKECVHYAISCGLTVNAGHGLNYCNVQLISQLPLYMLHIGHAIIARSVFFGLLSSVKNMKNIIRGVSQS